MKQNQSIYSYPHFSLSHTHTRTQAHKIKVLSSYAGISLNVFKICLQESYILNCADQQFEEQNCLN